MAFDRSKLVRQGDTQVNDWIPRQYLEFKTERTQPALDLLSRLRMVQPRSIVDIGCGPGNSTQVLHQRWPHAWVVGMDSSGAMIEQARQDYPDISWIVGDVAQLQTDDRYDIVFSNAALQWMPDHDLLIPRLFSFTTARGVLAVQVPANNTSALHQAVLSVAGRKEWGTSGSAEQLNYRPATYYYEILQQMTSTFDIWETTYYHILASHTALIDWYRSTGLRPFLEALPDAKSRLAFEDAVLSECLDAYPAQSDGKIVFPFRRIFFVAYK